jgi:ATP-dependent Clp protease ATP-binding subunit ClpA
MGTQMTDMLQHWAIMGRCSVEARRAVWHARNAVDEFGGSTITLEHFVLGLMAPDVRASAHFAALPEGGQDLRREIVALLSGSSRPATREVPLAAPVLRIMETARDEADNQGHARIQSSHFLLAILSANEAPVAGVLKAHGLLAEHVRGGMSGSGSEDDEA